MNTFELTNLHFFPGPREILFGKTYLFIAPERGAEFGVALTATNRPLDQIHFLPQVGQAEDADRHCVTEGQSRDEQAAVEQQLRPIFADDERPVRG